MAAKPIPGVQAFQGDSEEHLQSQAAILLSIGTQLRGVQIKSLWLDRTIEEMQSVGPAVQIPPAEAAELGIPALAPTPKRISPGSTWQYIGNRFGMRAGVETDTDLLYKIADDFYGNPSHPCAAALLAACMNHRYGLPRVAAASSYFHLTAEPRATINALLNGTKDSNQLTRTVAATALARVFSDHNALRDFSIHPERFQTASATAGNSTIIVHGTWARNGDWFLPGNPGNFYDYLKQNIASDMDQPFIWTGGWSDGARAQAAEELKDWVINNGHQGLNLFGHSHGGNVAMLANHMGVNYGKQLVLLSCPVHSDKYMPVFDPAPTNRVISVRVKMDLVILADGGGQRFRDSRIEENVLDIWFDHFATHDPKVWQDPKHQLPAKVDHT